jgi:hypothetical protein
VKTLGRDATGRGQSPLVIGSLCGITQANSRCMDFVQQGSPLRGPVARAKSAYASRRTLRRRRNVLRVTLLWGNS